jgi:hypothetical protein
MVYKFLGRGGMNLSLQKTSSPLQFEMVKRKRNLMVEFLGISTREGLVFYYQTHLVPFVSFCVYFEFSSQLNL